MTEIRERLQDLEIYLAHVEGDHHGTDQVVLHRERLQDTIGRAIEEIDRLRTRLERLADYD